MKNSAEKPRRRLKKGTVSALQDLAIVLLLVLGVALSAAGGLLPADVVAGWLAGKAQSGEEAEYVLYFPVDSQTEYGPALGTQPYQWEEPSQFQPLLEALLAGPTQEGLVSPFPRGVALSGWEWDRENEILQITLTEQYSGLGDISLTLADYCIVLTLCQLEGVESVEIKSAGYSVNYRSHQLLRPEEAELGLPDANGA